MSVSQTLRQATGEDAIDGVIPRHVALPESPEELAQILADASRDRQLIVLRGGGSKLGWGRVPSRVDLVIGTEKLNRLLAHRHGDMTVTAQAGMPLAELNRRLAEHRQYLPIESAFEPATIGGIVATNDSGPIRHRFGTPRDLLIGVTLAMTDGRLVKAGGTVVKNVAGYDLGKLVSGSHGTLAAIVDATFKLLPIPLASTTLVATYADGNALAHDVTVLSGSQVELSAFDMSVSNEGRWILLMRMASSPAATAAQAAEARRLLTSTPAAVSGDEERVALGRADSCALGGRWDGRSTQLAAIEVAGSRGSDLTYRSERVSGLNLHRTRDRVWAASTRGRRTARSLLPSVCCDRATMWDMSSCFGQHLRLKSQVDVWGSASGTHRRGANAQTQVRSGGHPECWTRTDLNLTFVNSQCPISNSQGVGTGLGVGSW